MSKSKGNIIRPQEIGEKYGADAIRYWAASSKLGADFDYQEKDVVTGAKFVTKIFNATKFVFMGIEKLKKMPKLQEIDRVFINQLNKVIANSTEAFEGYDYARAKLETDSFFWKSFCDNYMEIVKNRIYNGSKEEKESAMWVLYQSLFSILKMMAPITPFITEEIYHRYFQKNEGEKSIHLCSWPEKIEIKSEKADEKVWSRFVEILEKARRAKSEAKKSMKAEINLTLIKGDEKLLSGCMDDLKSVVNAKSIIEGKELVIEVL